MAEAPCVVLLDSDKPGDDAVKVLARGGPRHRELLPSNFVVQMGTWAATKPTIAANVVVRELEDLVPVSVAVAAARNYAVKVADVSHEAADRFGEDHVTQIRKESGSLFDALALAFTDCLGQDAHIEKVGFAKEVIAVLAASRGAAPSPAIEELQRKFGQLLSHLAKLLRRANQREEERRLNNRLNRTIAAFLDDYPTPTTRERGRLLIEDVEESVDSSPTGDRVRLQAAKLRREFGLEENLNEPIDHYDEFRERVKALHYEERLLKQDGGAVTVPELTDEVKAVPATAPDAPE